MATSESVDQGTVLTATDIRATQFSGSKGFGHGYDSGEVDQLVARAAAALDSLTVELTNARAEIAGLQARLAQQESGSAIEQAVGVLTKAQETADAILARAQAEREAAESAHAAALEAADETARRATEVEQQVLARVQRLTAVADQSQHEIDREAAYLQTFREASRSQIEDFIEGVLDHVAEQYGRAHPLAAQTAAALRRPTVGGAPSSRHTVPVRSRRGLRLAGHTWPPIDRSLERSFGRTSETASSWSVPPSSTRGDEPIDD